MKMLAILSAGIAFFLGAVAAPLAMVAAAGPPENGPVLVVAAPWGSGPEGLVRAVGGRTIGPRAAAFAVLAHSDDPAFAARLSNAGAWAVLDGASAALLCGGANP